MGCKQRRRDTEKKLNRKRKAGVGRHVRRPKLGQHFLVDASYRQRIAAMVDLRPEDLVVEIGPGRGAMTELLAERARQVVAVELDRMLAEQLQKKLATGSPIEVLQADVLAVDLGEVCRHHGTDRCFVFGNLPYYITSPIIHHLFAFRARIRSMGLLVQHEVAERLVAAPGTREYGYLSVLTQLFSYPRILLRVPPGAFAPPPKVQSTLLEFQMRETAALGSLLPNAEVAGFLQFVKRCFVQKRKNLPNNLAGFYSRVRVELELDRISLPHSVRAEQLTLKELLRLYRRLARPRE
jgi:16S rRNA (adenine1518-N6/adenine1519-N6)-dimethyltransferase